MSAIEMMPYELLVDEAGHLTEEGAALLADGEQDLIPAPLRAHADACPVCQHRTGDAALLSANVSQALASAVGRDARRSQERRPVPLRAVVAALLLASIGAVPAVLRAAQWVFETSAYLPRLVNVLVRTSLQLFHHSGTKVVPVVLATAATGTLLMLVTGWMVAHRPPRSPLAGRGA